MKSIEYECYFYFSLCVCINQKILCAFFQARMDTIRERDLRHAAEEKSKELRNMMEEQIKEVRRVADERMKQFHQAAEDRLSESKKEHARENDRLSVQVANSENRISELLQQVTRIDAELTSERADRRKDKTSFEVAIEKEKETVIELKEEIKALEKQLQESMDGSSSKVAELQAEISRITEQNSDGEREYKALIANLEAKFRDMHLSQESELELHKAAIDAHYVLNSEEEESTRFHKHLQELQSRVQSISAERDKLRAELFDFKAQLEEQTMECSALRLRLQLNESNLAYSSKGVREGENRTLTAPPPALSPTFARGSGGRGMSVPSPLFSDDQGFISLPGSPDGHYLSSGPPSNILREEQRYSNLPAEYDGRESFHRGKQSGVPPLHGAVAGAPVRRYSDPNSSSESLAKLVEENKQLRGVIREMRHEMESLPMVDSSEKDRIIAEKNERIADLEMQLGQAVKEVARLRSERKKLMDMSNELRASLFRMQNNMESPKENESLHLQERGYFPTTDSRQDHSKNPRIEKVRSGGAPSEKLDKLWGISRDHDGPSQPPPPPPAIEHQDPRNALAHGERAAKDVGVDGEMVSLAPFPLPSGRTSSSRSTPSQIRVLQKLKQNQSRASEPRKVMNYAAFDSHF